MPFTVHRAGFRLLSACALMGLVCLFLAPAVVVAQETTPIVSSGAPAVITGGGEQDVLLRAEPGFEAAAVTPLANGTPVQVLDGPVAAADGSSWYLIDVGGQVGYAPAGHLGGSAAAPVEPAPVEPAPVADEQAPPAPPVPDPAVASDVVAPAAGAAVTTTDVNLRSAPDGASTVLTTLPPGTPVEITGDGAGGFVPVVANGASGWIAAEYVQAAATAVPLPDPNVVMDAAAADSGAGSAAAAPAPAASSLAATTDANLRAEPFAEAAVIGSIPAGAPLEAGGVAENGFTPVSYNGQVGWVGSDLVSAGDGSAPAAAPGIDTTAAAPPRGSLISWPFSGGAWEVIQGYNNGTHQNRSSFANYQYSLDWARVDGNTAGQPIYAPVSGTISWIDRGSGGMLIDMGNGYGVAFFHATIDYSLSRGQAVQTGQQMGTISGPGGEGYMSTAHLDLTLWQLAGGGHIATPFTGQFAIGGMDFPNTGGGNEHMGVRVTP